MSTVQRETALSVLFSFLMLGVPAMVLGQAKQAAISGVVVDAVTGGPVSSAVVTLEGLAGATRQRMLTDTKGRFVFYPLDRGDDYSIAVERYGYAPGRYGWTPGASSMIRDRLRIALAPGEWRRDVSIKLWRLSSIEGRVFDEKGEPVVGAAVTTLAREWMAGRRRLVAGPVTTTDDRGVYRIEGLTTGEYLVGTLSTQSSVPSATPEAARTRSLGELDREGLRRITPTVSAPRSTVGDHRLLFTSAVVPPAPSTAGLAQAYSPTFHPNSVHVTATPVSLTMGEDRSGIDIQLLLAPTFTLTGRVVGPTAGGAVLRLMPRGLEELGFGFEVATALTDKDGSFRLFGVPRGDYVLLAQPSVMEFSKGDRPARMPVAPGFGVDQAMGGAYAGTPGLFFTNQTRGTLASWARLVVQVDGDVSELLVNLQNAISVSGRVETNGGLVPATLGRPTIFAEPADGDPSLGNPSTRVNDDGSFTLEGLMAGRYLLRTLAGPLIMAVNWQGRTVTDSGLDTAAGSSLDEVVVTMSTDGGSLSGKVDGASATEQAAVLIFPAQRSLWVDFGWNPSRIKAVQTDRNGTYSLTRLPAGDYLVIATEVGSASSWVNPEFLAAAAKLAVRQSVTWGEKATRDLAISKVVRK